MKLLNQIRELTNYFDLKYQNLCKILDDDKRIHYFDVHKETRLGKAEKTKAGKDDESDQAGKKFQSEQGEEYEDDDQDKIKYEVEFKYKMEDDMEKNLEYEAYCKQKAYEMADNGFNF